MSWTRAAKLCVLLPLSLLATCQSETTPRTQVMLEIDAEKPVRAALHSLRITAHTSSDMGKHWTQVFSDTRSEPSQPGFVWPARMALVPASGHLSHRFAIEVAVLGNDGAVLVKQSAVSQFAERKTKVLRLLLERACVDHEACAAGTCVGSECQTCRAGSCVEVGSIAALPDFSPDAFDAGAADSGDQDGGALRHDAGAPDAGVADSGAMDAGGGTLTLPEEVGGMGGSAELGGARDGQAGVSAGTGSSGHAGTAQQISGAGAELPATFRVEAVSPAADSNNVEPEASVAVSFSDELDSASLDETSFALMRDSQAIAGRFDVSARKVTFRPVAPLVLGVSYRLQLSAQLRDRAGRKLDPLALSFRVRDGAWSTLRLDAATPECSPNVAVANNGFATVVYSVAIEDVGTQLWARRYPLGASDWAAAEPVSMNRGRAGFRCRVAVNNLGYAVAAWDYADGVYQSGFGGAAAWSGESLVDGAAYGPQLALTETDRAYLVLQLAHSPVSGTIQGYDITAGQAGWTSRELGTLPFSSVPQLALLDNGAMAVWQQETSPDAGDPGLRIWAAGSGGLSCSSSSWACPMVISTGSTTASAPQVASDPARTMVVAVWQQADATWSHIWASRLNAGGKWSEPVRVSDDSGSASEPVVAVDALGRARALWQQNVAGSSRILSAVWTPGQAWSAPAYVSQATTERCAAPALAVEPGGSALVAWNQLASNVVSDLWLARFVEGRGWQTSKHTPASDAHAAAAPSVGIDRAGRGFVTWFEDGSAWAARLQ